MKHGLILVIPQEWFGQATKQNVAFQHQCLIEKWLPYAMLEVVKGS